MPSIDTKIGNEFQFDGFNRIGIKLDNTHDDNVLQLKEDGLYLNGDFVGSSEGFADGSYGVMRIGFASGFDRRSGYNATGRVTANVIVHRTFTTRLVDGATVTNFRSVDCYIPGDIIRVEQADGKFEYRLITGTTLGADPNARTNNSISSYVVLGTW